MKEEMQSSERLVLRVFARAMAWYDRNVAVGCVRDNFDGQTQALWAACAALRAEQKKLADDS